jgi:streptogramin lyase
LPEGVAVDTYGDLFIADAGNNVIEEVSPAGKLSVVAGTGTKGPPMSGPATKSALDGPTGVAVDAHGDLFIADYSNNVVEKVTF